MIGMDKNPINLNQREREISSGTGAELIKITYGFQRNNSISLSRMMV